MNRTEMQVLEAKAKPLLGTLPDKEIAIACGVNKNTIAYIRRKYEISAFDQTRSKQRGWSAEKVALLGKKTDLEIAKTFGIEPISVFRARKRRGIPAFRPKAISWDDIKNMDQSEFIATMLAHSGLNRRQLANAACVSFSRLEKWASPGGGREPMAIYIRRLIFLTAVYASSFQLNPT